MLRAVLMAFAFAFLVTGCPGMPNVPIPNPDDKPKVPTEPGDTELHEEEDMLCVPPAGGGAP
jgi:hypothetical protein